MLLRRVNYSRFVHNMHTKKRGKQLNVAASQSIGVGEAVSANKEQDAGSAGKMGACANAMAAVRCLVAVLTVACYYQTSNIKDCRRAIQ